MYFAVENNKGLFKGSGSDDVLQEKFARQAEEEYCTEEPAGDYDDNFDEEDVPGGIPVPGWLSGVFSWGHKVTKEMEGEAEPAPVDDSLAVSYTHLTLPTTERV